MNEIGAFAILSVPLLNFVSSGMLEFHRDRGSARSLARMGAACGWRCSFCSWKGFQSGGFGM